MDSRDDVIIIVMTSLDNSVLSKDKSAVVVNGSIPIVSDTEVSDDEVT